MGVSFKEVLDVINREESEYYRIYKNPNSNPSNKKFAFHAILTLKKLKEKIKNVRN
tara:strand:- start:781 stop:948 length:168 start_codon:yes stop_codon:yes gene_type:complete